MGCMYTNVTVRGPSQDEVLEYLTACGRRAYLSSRVKNCVVIFDEEADKQDTQVLTGLASALSSHFRCAALAILNHDDDIFWYQLHRVGELIDEYNSTPDYFRLPPAYPNVDSGPHLPPSGGDALKLCSAFEARD